MSLVIVARCFESARARYNAVHTHNTNKKLVSLMYSTVKIKNMYSYVEQVVPVVVFPVGAPRRDGQHRSDNGFSCAFFVLSSMLKADSLIAGCLRL